MSEGRWIKERKEGDFSESKHHETVGSAMSGAHTICQDTASKEDDKWVIDGSGKKYQICVRDTLRSLFECIDEENEDELDRCIKEIDRS